MSTAIPFEELTLDAVRNAKVRARRRGIELMLRSGRGEDVRQITPRDVRANDDLGITAGTENNEYVPAAGVAGTDLTYINQALTSNKFLIIFGIAVNSVATRPLISAVRFQTGAAGNNTKAEVDLQRGYPYNIHSWFLDDPVLYGPSETVFIQLEVANSWSVGDVTVPIMGIIFEPAGQTVA